MGMGSLGEDSEHRHRHVYGQNSSLYNDEFQVGKHFTAIGISLLWNAMCEHEGTSFMKSAKQVNNKGCSPL